MEIITDDVTDDEWITIVKYNNTKCRRYVSYYNPRIIWTTKPNSKINTDVLECEFKEVYTKYERIKKLNSL